MQPYVHGYSEKESIRLADQAGTLCYAFLKRRRHQAMTNLQVSPQAIVELTTEQPKITPKTNFVHHIF
jgi:predicted DNA-binding protein (MmcQ/YjbR family)